MLFAEALKKLQLKEAEGMRLPKWAEDVVIRVQFPDEHSKMTHPYLYVESRFGSVPWKETVPEMFDDEWELVNEIKEEPIVIESETNNVSIQDYLKNILFDDMLWYINETIDIINYSGSNESRRLRLAIESFYNKFNKIIDWNNLSAEVMDLFGFYKVTKEDITTFAERIMTDDYLSNEEKIQRFNSLKNIIRLRLIPSYLADAIPNGTELITIDGDIVIHDSMRFSRDNKNGYLIYGLNPKEEKNA